MWRVAAGTERQHPRKGKVEVLEHDELWLAVVGEWWVLCAQVERRRCIDELVLHAAAPFEPMADGRIEWIDLDLDFEVRGDDLSLEDEAEFHAHARTMALPGRRSCAAPGPASRRSRLATPPASGPSTASWRPASTELATGPASTCASAAAVTSRTRTTATPASSEASRSTSAAMIHSWSPSGSSSTWRTGPPAAGLVDLEERRAAGLRVGADRRVLVEVLVERRRPALPVPPGVAVELAELRDAAVRGQLDPPEQLVADEDPEGTRRWR